MNNLYVSTTKCRGKVTLQWYTYFGHISRSVECPLLAVSEERKVDLKKPRIIVADDDEDQTNRRVSTSHGEC